MNKYVLVIIDMQENFISAHNKYTISNIKKQINLAKKYNCPILVVEYITSGFAKNSQKTIPSIRKSLEGTNHFYIEKSNVDGSNEIDKFIKYKNLKGLRLRVVGIETNVCVAETVTSLIKKKYKISIVKDSCNHYDRYKIYHNKRSWVVKQQIDKTFLDFKKIGIKII